MEHDIENVNVTGMCDKTAVCAGFVINAKTGVVKFKTEIFWSPTSSKDCRGGDAAGTVYIKNYGYTTAAKASPNLFVADLNTELGALTNIEGLRVNGQRQIRAR